MAILRNSAPAPIFGKAPPKAITPILRTKDFYMPGNKDQQITSLDSPILSPADERASHERLKSLVYDTQQRRHRLTDWETDFLRNMIVSVVNGFGWEDLSPAQKKAWNEIEKKVYGT